MLKKMAEVKKVVGEAVAEMNRKHAGANIDEAMQYLSEAKNALMRNDLDGALELAKKAILAAKPTTDYLLSRAKKLDEEGREAYERGESFTSEREWGKSIEAYSAAIEKWRRSIEEYQRALELASERGEREIVEATRNTIESIKNDIKKVERARANREMNALVEEARRAAREAKELFNSEKFDDARERFESAKELYSKAASIAKDFEFKEDEEKIGRVVKEMDESVEACRLRKAEKLIKLAAKEKGKVKESKFLEILDYLNSFSSENELYEKLKKDTLKGIVEARIEIGKEMMEEGEELFNKREYYNAKEAYRRAQDYFEELSDYVLENRVDELKDEVDAHIDACISNIRMCTDVMVGRKEVEEATLINVGEIEGGVKPDEPKPIAHTLPEEILKFYAEFEYIGEGGYYWVYRARRKEDGTAVAVKISKYWDKKMRQEFIDEISIWKDLHHPNIASIYDFDVEPRGYVVMELADTSLDRIEKPMDPRNAAFIVFKIAEGLRYAHSKNVCHLDLKPSNILLKDKEPKIADWGMAKVLRKSRHSSGRAKGYTSLYSTPEQIKEEAVDERTDIFQLGHILYELVTGKAPFEAENEAAVLENIKGRDPVPPSKLNPDAKFLEPIIMKCLEKDKDKRYQSVRELQADLAEKLGVEVRVTRSRVQRVYAYTELIEMYLSLGDIRKCITWLKLMKNDVSSDVRTEIDEVVRMYDTYEKRRLDSLKEEIEERLDEIVKMARVKT